MTDAQKFKFYFPAWQECVLANRWHVENKTVVIDHERLTEEGRKVLAFARQIAATANRPLKLDDLRHGAHVLALGRDKSSEHLTNAEVDKVVCLFNVLADPEWLGDRRKSGMTQWLAYQNGGDPGAERRLDYVIKSIPDALARHIAADMLGTRCWEMCHVEQKRILARRIAQYKSSKRAKLSPPKTPVPTPAPVAIGADGDPDWSVE